MGTMAYHPAKRRARETFFISGLQKIFCCFKFMLHFYYKYNAIVDKLICTSLECIQTETNRTRAWNYWLKNKLHENQSRYAVKNSIDTIIAIASFGLAISVITKSNRFLKLDIRVEKNIVIGIVNGFNYFVSKMSQLFI